MAVEIFSGGWPDYPYEREALLLLAQQLNLMQDWFVLLVRMQIPDGDPPDLVVIKRNGLFILELKSCGSPVFSSVNGPWVLKDKAGEIIHQYISSDGLNPYQQAAKYW
jgi:hypothetical protein